MSLATRSSTVGQRISRRLSLANIASSCPATTLAKCGSPPRSLASLRLRSSYCIIMNGCLGGRSLWMINPKRIAILVESSASG